MSLNVYRIEELLGLEPPSWLVEGVVPENALVALYGQPGHGKSFVALDMALSIAAGIPWQGHAVQKGYVVYISAEGGAGLSKRVAAWLTHNHIPKSEYQHILANFVVSALQIHPESSDLDDVLDLSIHTRHYQELLASALEPDETAPPLFIVVDTLARCFVGDENQQEDMGNFIRGLDYLRDEHRATVLVVHHTRLGAERERGSTAFRGAADTMLKVEKNDMYVDITCDKQKDAEEFEPIGLELVRVAEVDSLALRASRHEAVKEQLAQRLQDVLAVGSQTWDEWLTATGLSRSDFMKTFTALKAKGFVHKVGETWELKKAKVEGGI